MTKTYQQIKEFVTEQRKSQGAVGVSTEALDIIEQQAKTITELSGYPDPISDDTKYVMVPITSTVMHEIELMRAELAELRQLRDAYAAMGETIIQDRG